MRRGPAMPPASRWRGSVLGKCRRCARAHRAGWAAAGHDERNARKAGTLQERRARDARGLRSGNCDSRRLRIRAAVDTARARQPVVGRAMRPCGDRREATVRRHGGSCCRCKCGHRRRDEIDRRNGTRRFVMQAVRARRSGAKRRARRDQRDQQDDDARHPASISYRRDRRLSRRRGGRSPAPGATAT